MAELVSVVVLNYNGKEFLEACLKSVLAQAYEPFEVILVDNASSDGSVEYVRSRFPAVEVVENEANLGFAEGNNRGVQHARGSLIVLLNNDTEVSSGWLSSLVQAVEPEDVAIASSLIKTQGVPERDYLRNGTLNFMGQNIMRAFDDPSDIFYCSGCSLIFKKGLIGLPFDPDYFAYSEDAWLGFRVRFMGLKAKHSNDSKVEHFGSATTKKQASSFVTFYQERNRLLNSLTFFSFWTRIRWIPYFAFNGLAKLLLGLLGRRVSFLGLMRAYGWLLFHPLIIARKRKALRVNQKVNEREVIQLMSGKLTNGDSGAARFLNSLSLLYCRLVGLKTIERTPMQFRGEG